jgi:hypothetical protein
MAASTLASGQGAIRQIAELVSGIVGWNVVADGYLLSETFSVGPRSRRRRPSKPENSFRLGLGKLHCVFFRRDRPTATAANGLPQNLPALENCRHVDVTLEHTARRGHHARFYGLVALGFLESHVIPHLFFRS